MAHLQDALIHHVFRAMGRLSVDARNRWADRLGRLFFSMDRRHRHIAMRNLVRALGREMSAEEIQTIALSVFQNLARILFEIGASLRMKREDLSRMVKIRGIENVKRALEKNRGLLVLTGHLGNWELLPVLAMSETLEVNVLFRPLDFPPLNRFFQMTRSRFGARLIPKARSARKILQALSHGEVVVVLMDQNVDWYEGVFVDFFGRRACTNKGLALIALKTNAPVVPIFLFREKNEFVAEIGREVPLVRTGDKTKDVEENTARYNAEIEKAVRRHPDQWLWVHQRWKTRPYKPWPRQSA